MSVPHVHNWKVWIVFLPVKYMVCKCNNVICITIYCLLIYTDSFLILLISLTKITTRDLSYESTII